MIVTVSIPDREKNTNPNCETIKCVLSRFALLVIVKCNKKRRKKKMCTYLALSFQLNTMNTKNITFVTYFVYI